MQQQVVLRHLEQLPQQVALKETTTTVVAGPVEDLQAVREMFHSVVAVALVPEALVFLL
jgi:hypothetical protein